MSTQRKLYLTLDERTDTALLTCDECLVTVYRSRCSDTMTTTTQLMTTVIRGVPRVSARLLCQTQQQQNINDGTHFFNKQVYYHSNQVYYRSNELVGNDASQYGSNDSAQL